MNEKKRTRYGQASLFGNLKLAVLLSILPIILVWKMLKAPFSPYDSRKSWRRVLSDSTMRFLSSYLDTFQFQLFFKPSLDSYLDWSRKHNLEPTVEEISEGGRLLWIGPKRTKKVILYFHSGGYILPLTDYCIQFWKWVQDEFEKEGVEVGIAALEYALLPEGYFPTQMTQAIRALTHITTTLGVDPQSIYLAGDSAGGNLCLTILSHILHPYPSLPAINLASPLRGVLLVSPWCYLIDRKGMKGINGHLDMTSARAAISAGKPFMARVPESAYPYVETLLAPKNWFEGVSDIAQRILIITGEFECLRFEDEELFKVLKKFHDQVELVVDPNGVHVDVMFHFMVGDEARREHPMFSVIKDWLRPGLID